MGNYQDIAADGTVASFNFGRVYVGNGSNSQLLPNGNLVIGLSSNKVSTINSHYIYFDALYGNWNANFRVSGDHTYYYLSSIGSSGGTVYMYFTSHNLNPRIYFGQTSSGVSSIAIAGSNNLTLSASDEIWIRTGSYYYTADTSRSYLYYPTIYNRITNALYIRDSNNTNIAYILNDGTAWFKGPLNVNSLTVSGNFTSGNPRAKTERTVNTQTISAGTSAAITFDYVEYDSALMFDGTSKFTIPSDGYYEVYISLALVSSAEIDAELYYNNNGNMIARSIIRNTITNSYMTIQLYDVNYFSQGDVVEFYMYNRGTADVVIGNHAQDNYAIIKRLD